MKKNFGSFLVQKSKQSLLKKGQHGQIPALVGSDEMKSDTE